jgi:hypothetical protein
MRSMAQALARKSKTPPHPCVPSNGRHGVVKTGDAPALNDVWSRRNMREANMRWSFVLGAPAACLVIACGNQIAEGSPAYRNAAPGRQCGKTCGFDVSQSQDTHPVAINSSDTITGYWTDRKRLTHGFIRAADGTITIFDAGIDGTNAMGISGDGWIIGYFHDKHFTAHGFLRTPEGTITGFDAPGCSDTLPVDINNQHLVAGYCTSADGRNIHGFAGPAEGEITLFDVHGSTQTVPSSISNGGAIVGSSTNQDGTVSAFVRGPNGKISVFGIGKSPAVYPQSIGLKKEVVGFYITGTEEHGFARDKAENITDISLGNGHATQARSVNARGEITGSFQDDVGYHAFTWKPDGQITAYDFHKATETDAVAINNHGDITGYYMQHGHAHGFLRKR